MQFLSYSIILRYTPNDIGIISKSACVSAGGFCSTISLGRGKFRCFRFFPISIVISIVRWQHTVFLSFYHFVSAIVIVSNQLFASRCILCVHIACWSAAAWGQHCAVLNSNSGVCCPHIGVFISLFLWLLSLVIAPAAWWSSSVITSCESINFRSYENAATRILQSRRPNFNRVFAFVRSHAK